MLLMASYRKQLSCPPMLPAVLGYRDHDSLFALAALHHLYSWYFWPSACTKYFAVLFGFNLSSTPPFPQCWEHL